MRQARDWGQHDLSMASGVPVPTLYRIEKGDIENPGIDKVVAIAKALGVTTSDLLGELPQEDAQAREIVRVVRSWKHDNQLGLAKLLAQAEPGMLIAVENILYIAMHERRGTTPNGLGPAEIVKSDK